MKRVRRTGVVAISLVLTTIAAACSGADAPPEATSAATDAPGCWHSARTSDWNSAPCTRLWNLGCIGADPFRCP